MGKIIQATGFDAQGSVGPQTKDGKIAFLIEQKQAYEDALKTEIAKRMYFKALLIVVLGEKQLVINQEELVKAARSMRDIDIAPIVGQDGKTTAITIGVTDVPQEPAAEGEPGVPCGSEANGPTEGSGDSGDPR